MQLRDRLEEVSLRLPVPARRLGYRLAYPLLVLSWIITGSTRPGVKCMLVRGEDVLLVRHTYGSSSWELPGGTLAAGEGPLDAARREMREELGVELAGARNLGARDLRAAPRAQGTIHYVTASIAGPGPCPNEGEIAEARFVARARLPEPLGVYVRDELALLDG